MTVRWTKGRDSFLRTWYGPQCRVDPAILAMSLDLAERTVIKRLSQLKLRSLRAERNVQKRQIAVGNAVAVTRFTNVHNCRPVVRAGLATPLR
jgi:hypothetical protein